MQFTISQPRTQCNTPFSESHMSDDSSYDNIPSYYNNNSKVGYINCSFQWGSYIELVPFLVKTRWRRSYHRSRFIGAYLANLLLQLPQAVFKLFFFRWNCFFQMVFFYVQMCNYEAHISTLQTYLHPLMIASIILLQQLITSQFQYVLTDSIGMMEVQSNGVLPAATSKDCLLPDNAKKSMAVPKLK